MESLEIIAHRGYSAEAPENTMAALRLALEVGADAVEFDMHVAACGTPVLIHDETLDRTTDGVGPVSRLTVDQLRRLDAGSWFGAGFVGERVPTFGEALEELKAAGATVYAEVKGYREVEDLARIAHIAADLGMAADVIFISLDFEIVEGIAAADTWARVGYVLDRHQQFQGAVRWARGLGSRAMVDLKHTLILEDPLLPPRARAQGVDLAVWTVDDVAEADALFGAGVRRFTTNRVRDLLRWKDAQPLPGGGKAG